jgi:hypothetical protein
MSELETAIDCAAAVADVKVKAQATTLLGKAKAVYAAGWPYWAPTVVLAALVGHAL